jgi:hypothetical protein
MNDIISADEVPLLFEDDRYQYNSLYGVGLLIGTLALGIHFCVAIIAGTNAALAYSYAPRGTTVVEMQSRLVLCVWLESTAIVLSGLSFLLLLTQFNSFWSTTPTTFYLLGLLVSFLDVRKLWAWKRTWEAHRLVFIALMFSIPSLILGMVIVHWSAMVIMSANSVTLFLHGTFLVRLSFLTDGQPAFADENFTLGRPESLVTVHWVTTFAVVLYATITRSLPLWVGITQLVCAFIIGTSISVTYFFNNRRTTQR